MKESTRSEFLIQSSAPGTGTSVPNGSAYATVYSMAALIIIVSKQLQERKKATKECALVNSDRKSGNCRSLF